ncbi:hypothetical protein ACO1O0_001991 [Amphichorda felina]
MSLPTQNPPLLLTKRLTSFLQANRTPQIPTLLITSPTGKLLAFASSQPVSVLRTHATVAASLLTIHTSSSPALPSALPGSQTPPAAERYADADDDDETGDENDKHQQQQHRARVDARNTLKPATITVQLTGGTVLIRRLKCGLLFVSVGPSSSASSSSSGGSPGTAAGGPGAATAAAADMMGAEQQSPRAPHMENGELLLSAGNHHHHHHHHAGVAAAAVSTSPSEVDSLFSAGAQTTASLEGQGATAVAAMRRHVADLARWLDDKLGTLTVPDDGVGAE